MEETNVVLVTSEISLAGIVDSTSNGPHLKEIKKEFSLSKPHSHGDFVEHAVVKHEDTSIHSLNLQVKSEAPDEKFGIESGNNDIHMELESLVSDELHIKNEVDDSPVEQTLKSSHQVKGSYFCPICSRKFALKKNLERHLNNHREAKPFKCNICHYKCARDGKLKQHIMTHTGGKPFKCPICDYQCIQNSNLQRHIKTHTGEKPFQCNLCDYRFVQKVNLQRHMQTHTGVKHFKCRVCNYRCIQKRDIQKHVKTHTGENVC